MGLRGLGRGVGRLGAGCCCSPSLWLAVRPCVWERKLAASWQRMESSSLAEGPARCVREACALTVSNLCRVLGVLVFPYRKRTNPVVGGEQLLHVWDCVRKGACNDLSRLLLPGVQSNGRNTLAYGASWGTASFGTRGRHCAAWTQVAR